METFRVRESKRDDIAILVEHVIKLAVEFGIVMWSAFWGRITSLDFLILVGATVAMLIELKKMWRNIWQPRTVLELRESGLSIPNQITLAWHDITLLQRTAGTDSYRIVAADGRSWRFESPPANKTDLLASIEFLRKHAPTHLTERL